MKKNSTQESSTEYSLELPQKKMMIFFYFLVPAFYTQRIQQEETIILTLYKTCLFT